MKVLFYVADQHPDRDRTRGITGYTDGLIRALRAQPEVRLSCLASRSSWSPEDSAVEKRFLPFHSDRAFGRLIGDHGHHFVSNTAEVDLWHYPKGFLPHFTRSNRPMVGTVHDLIIEHYAEKYPASRGRLAFSYWKAVLRRSIQRLDLVITVSEASRVSILSFCDRERLRCPPIVVTYEGARWQGDYPAAVVKGDHLLHFGSMQPHKRTDTLLDYWEMLRERRTDLPELRIVGSLSPEQVQRIAGTPRVSQVSWLSGEELATTIASALAVVVSSEIEGFGLPALEAYYLGTPVVFVKGTAVAEILGIASVAGGFSLDSIESFEQALEDVLTLDNRAIRSTADRLRATYAWDQCARRTIDAYRTLV